MTGNTRRKWVPAHGLANGPRAGTAHGTSQVTIRRHIATRNPAERTVDAPLELRDLYAAAYQNEPFVQILPPGELATLAHVTHTNRCVISLTFAADTLILTSATDNLLKGAAGQAVQNMNVMFGLEEDAGLI